MGDKNNKKPNQKGNSRDDQENNQPPSNVARNLEEDFQRADIEDAIDRAYSTFNLIARTLAFHWILQQTSDRNFNSLLLAALYRFLSVSANPITPTQTSTERSTEEEEQEEEQEEFFVSTHELRHSMQLSSKSLLLSNSRTSMSGRADNDDIEHHNNQVSVARQELELPRESTVEHLENGDAIIDGLVVPAENLQTPPGTPRRPSSPETPPAPVKKPKNETNDTDSDNDYLEATDDAEEDLSLADASPIAPPLFSEGFFSETRPESTEDPFVSSHSSDSGDDTTSFQGKDLFGNDDSDDDLPGSNQDYQQD